MKTESEVQAELIRISTEIDIKIRKFKATIFKTELDKAKVVSNIKTLDNKRTALQWVLDKDYTQDN